MLNKTDFMECKEGKDARATRKRKSSTKDAAQSGGVVSGALHGSHSVEVRPAVCELRPFSARRSRRNGALTFFLPPHSLPVRQRIIPDIHRRTPGCAAVVTHGLVGEL